MAVKLCKFRNGDIVEYDICSPDPYAFDEAIFEYVGVGRIHSLDGVEQLGKERLHFFSYNEAHAYLRDTEILDPR